MEYTKTMKELPASEQPYEKCERFGPGALSDAELLGVIIRSGTKEHSCVELARQLLANRKKEGLLSLYQMNLKELMQLKGIGKVKAVQLLCVAELSKRLARAEREPGASYNCPEKIASYYMEEMRHLTTEHVILVLLDSKCRRLKDMTISIGSVNEAIITPREVYIQALKYEAVSTVLLHNHPSGDPSPSKADFQTTKRMKEAGQLIGIPLSDHIIIGDQSYVSMREQGLL